MPPEPSIEDQLRQCWRMLMRAWSKRWRVIHRDTRDHANAKFCFDQAVRCRDMSLKS